MRNACLEECVTKAILGDYQSITLCQPMQKIAANEKQGLRRNKVTFY
jgi:hypothetical protein